MNLIFICDHLRFSLRAFFTIEEEVIHNFCFTLC
ncbi:hypothetical protein M2133_002882 [Parabacteroides sp. PF5-6]|nr:hypothetical protein [Parabacteroides sp. PF5-6]